MLIKELVYGTQVESNLPPACDVPFLVFHGDYEHQRREFGMNRDQLGKNILFVGCTGCGKTSAINMAVEQIKQSMCEDDVMLIFDTKGDYEEAFFDSARGDVLIGNSSKYKHRSEKWNLYKEVLADGADEVSIQQNIGEIGRSLFARNVSVQQPFFANAARGVFGGVLLGFLRGNEQFRRKHLNNKKLADFFNAAKKDNYEALIRSFPDLGFLKLYLGDYNNTQALGVLAEILVMVKDTFFGVFSEVGEFSVREFIRNRGGKTLFLEYDMAIGESLTPLYSLLVDLALKEAMSQNNPSVQKGKNRGRVYIVIDEFKLLPHLQHIDDAVNFGRGMGVSVMAGLQSIHQIYANYGESQGGALLSGFCSVIAFRQNDAVSRDYVRELFGRNLVNETVYSTGGGITSERRGGYVVEDWVIERLNIGEAVIGIDGKAPFIMHFDKDDRRKRGGSAWQ